MTTRVAFKQALGKGRRWGRELVFSLNTPALQEFVTTAVSGAFTSPGGTQVGCKFGWGRGGEGRKITPQYKLQWRSKVLEPKHVILVKVGTSPRFHPEQC